jgi:hypothetical protein
MQSRTGAANTTSNSANVIHEGASGSTAQRWPAPPGQAAPATHAEFCANA